MPTGEDLAAFQSLSMLSPQQRAVLAEFCRAVSVRAGEAIFEQGEPADGCWLIVKGRVTLESDQPGGVRQSIQTLGAGDLLGWSWLVPPYRWRLAARAVDDVSAIRLDTTALRSYAERDPTFGYPLLLGLIGALLPRLHGSRARLLDLYRNPREVAR